MVTETRRRGRPPKAPRDRRDKVVPVRFAADEWQGLGFEMAYAQRMGVRVSRSDLIRKAVRLYVARQDLKRDYPEPKKRRRVR